MSGQIVFLDAATLSIGDVDYSLLEDLGDVVIFERTTQDEVLDRCRAATVIITNKVVIDAAVMEALPQLKYVCVAATGYNVVDVQAARARGIEVSNVSGYSTAAVVQHTFALLLAGLNRVGIYNEQVHLGRWQSAEDFTFYDHSITELAGKKLGIIGLGTIGQQVAAVGRAFGMQILSSHREGRQALPDVKYLSIDALFETVDVLSLHAPLTADTRHLVNYERLSLMKDTSILINTARGPLVQEEDLARALREEMIAFAGIDVLTEEPPAKGSPLFGLNNCIITPHQAWASVESRRRLLSGIVANIKSFRSEGSTLNRVDLPL